MYNVIIQQVYYTTSTIIYYNIYSLNSLISSSPTWKHHKLPVTNNSVYRVAIVVLYDCYITVSVGRALAGAGRKQVLDMRVYQLSIVL